MTLRVIGISCSKVDNRNCKIGPASLVCMVTCPPSLFLSEKTQHYTCFWIRFRPRELHHAAKEKSSSSGALKRQAPSSTKAMDELLSRVQCSHSWRKAIMGSMLDALRAGR